MPQKPSMRMKCHLGSGYLDADKKKDNQALLNSAIEIKEFAMRIAGFPEDTVRGDFDKIGQACMSIIYRLTGVEHWSGKQWDTIPKLLPEHKPDKENKSD